MFMIMRAGKLTDLSRGRMSHNQCRKEADVKKTANVSAVFATHINSTTLST